jgi:hypothetical protein
MQIVIKNVRLSFPNLFKAASFQGAGGEQTDPKYSATFIMDKDENAADIKRIQDGIDSLVKEYFKGNSKALKGVCLREGAEKTDEDGTPKDGFGEQIMFITASNKNRPQVVDRIKTIPLTEEDNKMYPGCYVNAVITLWAQNNKFGKRINANLLAVQYVKDGIPFGEARVDVGSVFDDIEDESESMLD